MNLMVRFIDHSPPTLLKKKTAHSGGLNKCNIYFINFLTINSPYREATLDRPTHGSHRLMPVYRQIPLGLPYYRNRQ